jgi:hypothetical protein
LSDASRTVELDGELYERVCSAVRPGDEITTLSNKRVNRIASLGPPGVFVETSRSDARGTGPQLVPAWMIQTAWDHLCRTGELSHRELLNVLNVKRSAFVCALLALFPDVIARSTRPTVLELVGGRVP